MEPFMDTLNTPTIALIVGVVFLILVVLAAITAQRKRRTEHLQQRFGPEYGRAVDERGSRSKAEADLRERERRVEKLSIVRLSPDEAARFSQAWSAVQGRFVDSPQVALADADRLVRELMQRRGYPVADFETRAADISVDHPTVVEHYRAAQAIALRERSGEATTEDMRRAVVHYRALFEDLLEVNAPIARMPSSIPHHAGAR
jgi:hypothetical protein